MPGRRGTLTTLYKTPTMHVEWQRASVMLWSAYKRHRSTIDELFDGVVRSHVRMNRAGSPKRTRVDLLTNIREKEVPQDDHVYQEMPKFNVAEVGQEQGQNTLCSKGGNTQVLYMK